MNDDQILDRLRATCVQFIDVNGLPASGFVIARGFAVTALHCVASVRTEPFTVNVGWGEGKTRVVSAVIHGKSTVADVAIVRLSGCDDIVPFPVGEDAPHEAKWFGFAFPRMAKSAGKFQGLPIIGKVRDARWSQREKPYLLLESKECQTSTTMEGCSGSLVVVNGAIVGSLAEQFRHPIRTDEAVLGLVKACPISFALDLLPSDAQFERAARSPVAAHQSDFEMADLVSWCDREDVVEALEKWLTDKPGNAKGMMCIVGRRDNRPRRLMYRVGLELSEQGTASAVTSIYVPDKIDPHDDAHFRSKICKALGIKPSMPIEHSTKLRSKSGLILLTVKCDLTGWPAKDLERRIIQAARWLESVTLNGHKLVVVLVMNYHKFAAFTRLLHRFNLRTPMKMVLDAVDGARRNHQAVEQLLIAEPLPLADYDLDSVLEWAGLDLVAKGLGKKAGGIESEVQRWFQDEDEVGHEELIGLLNTYYKSDH